MVRELLWGEGRDEERINRSSADDVPVQGFGESVVMKLFAIAHPEHWLPLFSLAGESGKIAMLAPARRPGTLDRGQVPRPHARRDQRAAAPDARPAARRTTPGARRSSPTG